MTLDPAGWDYKLQRAVFVGWIALGILVPIADRLGVPYLHPVAAAVALLYPGVVGAMAWRFLHASWRDIASWTIPVTLLAGLGLALPVPLRWLFGIVVVGWMVAFVFWDAAADWWYRAVLRRPSGLRMK